MTSDKPKGPEPQEIVTRIPLTLDFRHLLAPRPEEVAIRGLLMQVAAGGLGQFAAREQIGFLLGEIEKLRGALRYREIEASMRAAAS